MCIDRFMDTEGEFIGHAGGVYHGKVKFPPEYPYKPPGIRFAHPFLLKFLTQSAMLFSVALRHVMYTNLSGVLFWDSMITPNGRFATQKRICMSMSDCTSLCP